MTDSGTHGVEKANIQNDRSGKAESSWRRCCSVSMWPFSVYYGFVGLVTSALGSYLTSQITTLEKQFGLSSSESGLLLSMNDIGYLVTVLIVSYFGRNSNIPRILGVCCFLFGISALICSAPHLFTDNSLVSPSNANFSTNQTSNTEDHLCTLGLTNPPSQAKECTKNDKSFYSTAKTAAMAFISCGMIIQGAANAPRIPLVQTYVDDNVPEVKSGFFIGIISSLAIFGPSISFGIGGAISRIFVTLQETGMSSRDPRWVGAWWLGFLVFGSIAIVLSFPVCLFPKSLTKKSDEYSGSADKETTKTTTSLKSIFKSIKGIFPALKRVLTNPVYVFFAIGTGLRFFGYAGIVSFTPKYMQIHYSLSIYKSNLLIGFLRVGSSATAIFIGGIITRKFRLELKGNIMFVFVVQLISSIIMLIGILFACPQPEIQGFQINSQSISRIEVFAENRTSCFAGCNCDDTNFFPICGANGVSYFSPCHAGCQGKTSRGYTECLCMSGHMTGPGNSTADASPGMCGNECSFYVPFLVISILSGFIGALAAAPAALVSLRSVESRDKSLAVGVTSFSCSLLGWILAPIIMGNVIDGTCRLWETACSREGSCAVYDIRDFRLKFHGIDAGVSLIYLSCFMISYVFLLRREKRELTICATDNQADVKESEMK